MTDHHTARLPTTPAEVAADALSRALDQAQAENARLTAELDGWKFQHDIELSRADTWIKYALNYGAWARAWKAAAKKRYAAEHDRDDAHSTAAEAGLRAGALAGLLGQSYRQHNCVDEDCFYSCPKSDDYCGELRSDVCLCGADDWNSKLDAALARPGVEEGV